MKDFISISLKDFGPMNNVTLDLKPLTIIIGANGTGKSDISKVVYSFLGVLKRLQRLFEFPYRHSLYTNLPLNRIKSRADKFEYFISPVAKNKFKTMEMDNKIKSDLFKDFLFVLKKYVKKYLHAELEQNFGVESSELIRRGTNEFEIKIKTKDINWFFSLDSNNQVKVDVRCDNISEIVDSFSISIKKRNRNRKVLTTEYKGYLSDTSFPLSYDINGLDTPEIYESKDLWAQMITITSSTFMRYIVRDSIDSFYLPAERSGILLGYRAITKDVLDQASIKDKKVPFSGVVLDFIKKIIDFTDRKFARQIQHLDDSEFIKTEDIANRVEREILFGEVIIQHRPYGIDSLPNIEFIYEGGTYPLQRVSSMVSELIPYILCLRYLSLKQINFLIIEEPESHLHPSAQRIIAKTIVNLVRCGIKVIITTHSDFFLQQISNLIVPKIKTENKTKKENSLTDEILSSEIEPILIKITAKGGTISEKLPISDEGIFPKSFIEVAEALYEESLKEGE